MEAVTGKRTLPGTLLRNMARIENIVNAYRARERAQGEEGGWAAWSEKNPHAVELLNDALEAMNREDKCQK